MEKVTREEDITISSTSEMLLGILFYICLLPYISASALEHHPIRGIRIQIGNVTHEQHAILSQQLTESYVATLRDRIIKLLYPTNHMWRRSEKIIAEGIVTIEFLPVDAVAFTNQNHIVISTRYLEEIGYFSNPRKMRQELKGVIVHEMVHTCQHPLYGVPEFRRHAMIEGIADYVRNRLACRSRNCGIGSRILQAKEWFAGYQDTAVFFEWASHYTGDHMLVSKLNRDKITWVRILELGDLYTTWRKTKFLL
jgi:hypothetical protein